MVGKEFGGVNSDALMDAVKQQASKFFTVYHKYVVCSYVRPKISLLDSRTKLEELHFFIDNECWEVCPMKNRFTCFDLWVSAQFFAMAMVKILLVSVISLRELSVIFDHGTYVCYVRGLLRW